MSPHCALPISVLLQLRRRSADLGIWSGQHIEGFRGPVHGSLGSPLLLRGAPRGIAIVNGTLAAAVGLGLQQWLAGLALWAIGHSIAVMAARRDPSFAPVLMRHLRQKGYFACCRPDHDVPQRVSRALRAARERKSAV